MRNQIQDGTQEELLKTWLPESETSESAQIQGYKNLLRVGYVKTQETWKVQRLLLECCMETSQEQGAGINKRCR